METDAHSDLISTLPDPILHHILGLLKTKQAVQTCALSKRWEHLWAFLPSLHFDFADFFDWNDLQVTCSKRFVKFVNMLMRKRNSLPLDMFHFSGDHSYLAYADHDEDFFYEYQNHVRKCLLYAAKHNTRVLDLSYLPDNSIPSCIYTCSSLEELYLNDCQTNASGVVNLPNLRKLSIYNVYRDDQFFHNLLTGSTILEILQLDQCWFDEYIIAHEFLKHLSIKDCNMTEEPILSVGAPKLLSFSYYGELPFSPQKTLSMPSLVSADIKIGMPEVFEICDKLVPLLSALANVERLELQVESCACLEHLGFELPELPTFQNLKNVRFGFCSCIIFQMVAWILKSTPNLEKLTILQQPCYSKTSTSAYELVIKASRIEASACKNLKIVEIKYSKSDWKLDRLVDALTDGANESGNLKIILSKFER